jgi:hypothetical protein
LFRCALLLGWDRSNEEWQPAALRANLPVALKLLLVDLTEDLPAVLDEWAGDPAPSSDYPE